MYKKSFFISFLLSFLTFQINSYFCRGTIYKNGDKFVILLGDCHSFSKEKNIGEKQKAKLIKNLKLCPKKSTLVLVEDHNKKNLQLMQGEQAKKVFPLFFLVSSLQKENLEAINVDCRDAYIAYQMKIHPYSGFISKIKEKIQMVEKCEEILKETCFEDISLKDVLKEFHENLKRIGQYAKEIKKTNLINRDFIFDFYSKEKEKILASTKVDISLLEKYSKMTAEDYFDVYHKKEKKLYSLEAKQQKSLSKYEFFKKQDQIMRRLDSDDAISGFLDMNIVHNIVSKNKKIMVVCAGLAHTLKVESFLEKIGYKCAKVIGVKNGSVFTQDCGPIDVNKIFAPLHSKLK